MEKLTHKINEMSIAELMELRLIVANRISKEEERAFEALNNGETVPGFRLKKGRKTRKVANEQALVAAMENKFSLPRDQFYARKLIGVPAIETILKTRLQDKDKVAAFLHDHIRVDFSNPSLEYVGA